MKEMKDPMGLEENYFRRTRDRLIHRWIAAELSAPVFSVKIDISDAPIDVQERYRQITPPTLARSRCYIGFVIPNVSQHSL